MIRRIPSWIGAPAIVGGALACAAAGQNDGGHPLLLTAGIMGLGAMTLASERWRRRSPGVAETPHDPVEPGQVARS